MKKGILFFVFLMIFTMIVPALGISMPESELSSMLVTNEVYGKYVVWVKTIDGWKEIGDLDFGKHPSRQEINIGNYYNDKPIIKLTQDGGGAAYLDTVLLDGIPAIRVNYEEGKLLDKLSREDLDITPVGDEGVVLEFTSWEDGILTVVGRIEPEVIGKEPLQFPVENNYKSKEEIEDFYIYTLGSNLGTLKVDGIIDEVSDMEPFVNEYRVPGSGHPAGVIYFWVMNDDENLYVTMDVTPDNTYDGDEDYAKVYIKTRDGIKEFKISVPEIKWGNTGFTYTDKVVYEHKVYEFRIPLDEIDADLGKEINIAFAAYGTMAAQLGYHNPSVAYDTKNNVYVCVFEHVKDIQHEDYFSPVSEIYADVISSEGEVIISDFPLSTYEEVAEYDEELYNFYQFTPSIAYDSESGNFLVTWHLNYNTILAKYLTVNDDFTISSGNLIKVSDEEQATYYPVLAYSNNGRFLIAWVEFNDGVYSICGKIISEEKLIGEKIEIIKGSSVEMFPNVSYKSNNFLVVWDGWDDDNYVYGQIVSYEGEVLDQDPIIIGNGFYPNISINPNNDMFLVTWQDYNEIYGRYISISDSGITVSEDIIEILANEYIYFRFPSSYYAGGDGMLCVWGSAPAEMESYPRLRYIYGKGENLSSYFEDESKIRVDTPIAITGNNKGINLIAYEIVWSNDIGYRLIGSEQPPIEPKEPSLTIEPNKIEKYVGEEFSIKINYFDGSEDFDLTDQVAIAFDDPIVTSTAIKGVFKCIAPGETRLRTTYAGITATASLKVKEKTIPPSRPTNVKTPVGQILVDNKLVKTIYKEDFKVKDNTYTFTADKEGKSANLWLDSKFYSDLADKYPNRIIKFNWDQGTYTLPLNCDEVLKEIDSLSKKVYILIENIDDEELIASARISAIDMGAEIISDLIDFSVFIEKSKENVDIESLEFYGERTINKLDEIDRDISTAMKFVEDREILTFAPSVFDDNFVTIKYRGNGIFTVIENPQTFKDISNHWAKINIEKLAIRNIAFGRENHNFVPDDFVTRAEFAVMITRALGITEEEGSSSFKDVSNEWFAKNIGAAFEAGLIKGRNDGNFYPNEKILRKDMAVMINNALKFANNELKITDIENRLAMFKDNALIDDYAKESVAQCAEAGIIMGRDTRNFDPNDNATRAEASAIIERMLKYLEFIN